MEFYINILHLVTMYIGIAVITLGVALSVAELVKMLYAKNPDLLYRQARMILCKHIVFGLEFMLAGDVVKTIVMPDYHSLALLGGLVVIRTILSYFVDVELRQLRKS
ncbi:MAG: putative membrane protein [Alteromonas naphthalenivorans]|jgi:uncharacterized membrane protein